MRSLKKTAQKGFTVIELIIVVILLGVLIVIVAGQFTQGTTDSSRAFALYESAKKLGSNWSLLNQSCGTSTQLIGTGPSATGAVVATTSTALKVLFEGGTSQVKPEYAACYTQSNIKPLSAIGQRDATGAWKVQGFAVEMAGGGNGTLQVIYRNVPDAVIQPLVTRYGSGQPSLAASDTSDPNIQYSAGSGVRDLTILIRM
jgi:prepilin-type N-terminal cleavage/methylation domain-containing protein